jgi:hypothetical protein
MEGLSLHGGVWCGGGQALVNPPSSCLIYAKILPHATPGVLGVREGGGGSPPHSDLERERERERESQPWLYMEMRKLLALGGRGADPPETGPGGLNRRAEEAEPEEEPFLRRRRTEEAAMHGLSFLIACACVIRLPVMIY